MRRSYVITLLLLASLVSVYSQAENRQSVSEKRPTLISSNDCPGLGIDLAQSSSFKITPATITCQIGKSVEVSLALQNTTPSALYFSGLGITEIFLKKFGQQKDFIAGPYLSEKRGIQDFAPTVNNYQLLLPKQSMFIKYQLIVLVDCGAYNPQSVRDIQSVDSNNRPVIRACLEVPNVGVYQIKASLTNWHLLSIAENGQTRTAVGIIDSNYSKFIVKSQESK